MVDDDSAVLQAVGVDGDGLSPTFFAASTDRRKKARYDSLCSGSMRERSASPLKPDMPIPAFSAAAFTASRSLSVQFQNSTNSKPLSFAARNRSRKES